MNPQLIQKILKFNNDEAPDFTYTNPILDPNVARALSKSFVKILTSDENTNVSNNLRLSIMENIRKICKTEPGGHIPLTEDHTELLVDFYKNHILNSSNSKNSVEKDLNAYLIRNFKQLNINSDYATKVNPEIFQALINLSGGVEEKLFKDLIHWDTSDSSMQLINSLWNQTTNSLLVNDIVIKMKPVIEKILIDSCLKSLEDDTFSVEAELSNEQYKKLFKTCAISTYCFEICIYVLNLLLISTNFNCKLFPLIEGFICNVKTNCSEAISSLYPAHLCHIAVFLDTDLSAFPEDIRKEYVDVALNFLKDVKNNSKSDFIMLLSHFPQWFELTV